MNQKKSGKREIVGHEAAVDLLHNCLNNGRLSHAYLFVGPPHVGKMTLAIHLAQALNCEASEKPCGECPSCQRIAELKHADVQVIGLEGQVGKAEISIDRVRELERSATLKPFEGKSRVFIIDGAEHLSTEGANCLLKTLEEPPPYVHIILLATNERLLLPTVRSRCQRLELRPLPIEAVERALIEQWEVEPKQARLLARLSLGRPGWALNATRDEAILNERAERLSAINQLAAEGRAEQFAYATHLAGQFNKNRETVRETLTLWVGWWRDLLLIKAGCDDFITNIDQEATLHREAESYVLKGIKGFIDSLHLAAAALGQNANPRLALEVLMLNLPNRKGG